MVAPLLDAVRSFSARELDALALDREGKIPARVLSGLAELGLFGLTMPEAYGGAGLGLPEACAVVATLAEADRSVAVTLGLHLGLGTRGLVAYGPESLKQRFGPKLAAGEKIAAFCTTEPNAGSDLSVLATTLVEAGGTRRVTGQKAFVTNGGFAGMYTVAAQRPGTAARSTALVVLEPGQQGFTIGPEEKKLGLKASSTTPLYFDEVEVAKDAVLSGPDDGNAQLAHILCWGRLLMSAGCVGAARAALAKALDYVALRKQFKKPLAQQEVVRRRLGRMSALLFGMRSLVQDAAHAQTEGALVGLSTSAKLLCSEGAFDIADQALQLHGGNGYLEETGLALILRDARVTRIFEGANDVLWTHRGALLATAAPTWGEPAQPGRAAAAASALREVLVTESGVRLMGQKDALHRLGQAAMWADASTAAWRWAKSDAERALAQNLEEQAMQGIAASSKQKSNDCAEAEWQAAAAMEWT